MPADYQTIGKREIRKDSLQKVQGQALYTADIKLKNTHWGSVFRSTVHAAKIVGLDVSAAVHFPGVLRVITAADIPGVKAFGALVADQPPLAWDEIRHFGEPIAIVIAKTRKIAQEARSKIRVSYEAYFPIFDPEQALEENARRIHPGGNLLTSYCVENGDLGAGFAQSDVIIEEVFSVPRISPAYLETENSLARWNEEDSVTVWVSSQQPFHDQEKISSVLNIPLDQVQVISAVIGGAFGGKEDSEVSILAGLSAYLTKSTVRICNDRRESFLAHPKRHPAKVRIKMGAKSDGTLTALDAHVIMDTGAYASYGPAVGGILTETVGGSYRIANMRVNTLIAYTNSPLSGAMRGFGAPQSHFAIESMIDILAEKLHLDPLALRKKNILRPGDSLFTKVVVNETAASLPLILEKFEEFSKKYASVPAKKGKQSGIGFACAIQTMGLGAKIPDLSSHRLLWQPDGAVLLQLGSPELGQGLTTIAEQVIAEKMGLPFSQIHTAELDTRTTPDGNVSCASRMTYMVGNAVASAADSLIEQLLDHAVRVTKRSRSSLKYERGNIIGPEDLKISASDLLAHLAENDISLQAVGTSSFPYPPETTPQHLPVGMPHVMFVFAGQIARVEVDPELGTVEVTHFASIHDVGKVINPIGVEGQIEGGVAMGLGYSLLEDLLIKPNGEWVSSFSQYLLPTTLDMPGNLEVVILEIPEKTGPFGAKGLAEICLVPTGPTIANAIFNATGKRVTHLPIKPEDLL
ncbi:MAG: xanthine dehydrogenase family protein molybdopterin-binding subunit [Chloroflexi bacterium]|nr:xanthine dehydrogenase family protein molybdopterin-binding subunit [Chloroflexota bacterium]